MNNTANNKKPLILFIALGLIVGIVYLAIFKSIPRLTDSGFHSFKNYLTIGLTTSYTCLMIALAFDGKKSVRLIFESMFIAAIFGSIVILMNDSDIKYAVLLLPPGIFAAINFLHSYHQANYKAPPYELFFSALWNNICVIIVAIFFLLVTNLFLLAWAGLFYTLGIPQLLRALSNSYFTWLINPVIYFLGLYIAFRWEKILNSLRMIIFNFFAVLLPITMVFGWTMFLASLVNIFTASTKYISSLTCLSVAFCSIIFINTVYQDGNAIAKISKTYKAIVNLLILLLPLLVMLGIYIQVKHGQLPILNRDSIGFFALAILFLSYSFTYLYGAFAKQLPWLSTLKRSNIILAWVLIVFAILFNINFIINLLPKVH